MTESVSVSMMSQLSWGKKITHPKLIYMSTQNAALILA